jgi:3-phosphoshikimate 1-carboxyvinyltransferase
MIVRITGGEAEGRVTAPSSKSMTHRMLLCSALTRGRSIVRAPLDCDDTRATRRVLGEMGIEVSGGHSLWEVEGGTFRRPATELHCGESGTTLRLVTAACALVDGVCRLTGDSSLAKRPIKDLVEGLNQLGVECECDGEYPPVTVRGTGAIEGGEAEIPGDVSSQFVSALLLVAPMAKRPSTIRLTTPLESKPYVSMTMDAQRLFGVTAEASEDMLSYRVEPQEYGPSEVSVEGDWSSAAYLLAAGALAGRVSVDNLNMASSQADREIVEILSKMGAKKGIYGDSIILERTQLRGIEADLSDCPDLFPVVAILCAVSKGESILRGLKRLRFKESDRLSAMVENLRRMGVETRQEGDILYIEGGSPKGGLVDPRKDHRIAMALAVLGLISESETTILDAECVSKSYPGFWGDLRSLGVNLSGV